METFGWCFIGTGKLAGQVAQQLAGTRHKIVSCYTRNFENAKTFAASVGAEAYEEATDAITAPGVDAVYVVTPHNAHFRFAKLALQLGKPVLCEKSFTVTARETEELIALARGKGVYLAEAMWTWFSPAANQVKAWVDGGAIGDVTGADFTYHMISRYGGRTTDPRRAGGALLNITVYPITYAYRLFGYPEKIQATGVIAGGVDQSEEIEMVFPGGVCCHISASAVDKKGFEKMTIRGSRGKIKALLYHALNRATLRKGLLGRTVFKGPGGLFNSYVTEFDIAAREIREGLTESKMVPLQATCDVMKIMDTIRGQIGLEYPDLE